MLTMLTRRTPAIQYTASAGTEFDYSQKAIEISVFQWYKTKTRLMFESCLHCLFQRCKALILTV